MKCTQCQQDKSNYNFYKPFGKQQVARQNFFTRPVQEVSGLCFECAGPYCCLKCGHEKHSSEFRVQGRICRDCKTKKTPKPQQDIQHQKEKRNQEKARAHVNQAIRKGLLAPPTIQVCAIKDSNCGYQAQQYHHYLGYEKEHWLDVIPVCSSCHVREHLRLRAST